MANISSINGNPIVVGANGIQDNSIPDAKLVQTGGMLTAINGLIGVGIEHGKLDLDGNYSDASGYKCTKLLPCVPNTTMTISGALTDNQYAPAVTFYRSNGNYTGNAGKNVGGDTITVTTTQYAAYFRVNAKESSQIDISYEFSDYAKIVKRVLELDGYSIKNSYSVQSRSDLSDLNNAPLNSIGFFQIPLSTSAENMPDNYPNGTSVLQGYGILFTIARIDLQSSVAQIYFTVHNTPDGRIYQRQGAAGTWTKWSTSYVKDKIPQIANMYIGWRGHDSDSGFERSIVKIKKSYDLYFNGAATSNQYFNYLEFVDAYGSYLADGSRKATGNAEDTVASSEYPDDAVYAVITYARGKLKDSTITNGTSTQFVSPNTLDLLGSDKEDVRAEIVIPSKVTAVVGDTLQIYYDSIVNSTDDVTVEFLGAKGKSYERYFEYTPAAGDVGASSMTIKANRYNNINSSYSDTIASKSITIDTVAVPQSPSDEKHVLCIGDSTIVGGDYVKEVARRLCSSGGSPSGDGLSNIKFTGRLAKSVDGIQVGYEGTSGWSWNTYISGASKAIRFYVNDVSALNFEAVYQDQNGCRYNIAEVNVTDGSGNIRCTYVMGSATTTPPSIGTLTRISGSGDASISYTNINVEEFSPFVRDGQVTFTPYVEEYCDGQVDCVVFSLGTNVIVNSNTEFATMKNTVLNQMATLIDKLHEQYPSAVVLLCTLQKGSMNGGFGHNFGAANNASSEFYNHKVYQLNKAYLEFASVRSYVELADVCGEFDTVYDYPHTQKDVNVRNSIEKEMVDTNFGHPSLIGYMQIADAIYRAIVGAIPRI